MIRQVYATKQSMKQVFLEGRRVPVTLLKVSPHRIIDQRTKDKHGYTAAVIGLGKKDKPRRVSKALQNSLKKNNINYIPQHIKEIKVPQNEELSLGQEIDLIDILLPGSLIQISGLSKGKGFTGTIKRWNFSAQSRTHGQSDRRRAPGSIGRGTTPGRVLPGKKMAGHHGHQTAHVANLTIVSYDPKNQILTVSGPVPGARHTLLKIDILKPGQPVEKQEKTRKEDKSKSAKEETNKVEEDKKSNKKEEKVDKKEEK